LKTNNKRKRKGTREVKDNKKQDTTNATTKNTHKHTMAKRGRGSESEIPTLINTGKTLFQGGEGEFVRGGFQNLVDKFRPSGGGTSSTKLNVWAGQD